jgi:DNA repair exonuclease SbcCD nuclease subunit
MPETVPSLCIKKSVFLIIMKFSHLADCHIGSWRDPSLANLSTIAFEKAIDKSIEEKVDFIIIAGDLFNTALPSIDKLKLATSKLKQLLDKDIPVYLIAGSHDFSPSGKTMLDVLENAGLVINVAKGEEINNKLKLKFTTDKKTGTKITGMLGKKGGLEKSYYENLLKEELESELGTKIFLFHSLLTELKPKSLEKADSQPLSLLPKNFTYYAGGHPHFIYSEKHEDYGTISYPGPLFPNNFKELEELKHGGFYIVEDNVPEWVPVKLYDVESISIECDHKVPEDIEKEIKDKIKEKEFKDKIVTLRLAGTLESGKPSDIDFKNIFSLLKEKGAYTILKNSSALTSKEFEDIKVDTSNTEEIEETLIAEQIAKDDLEDKDAIELTKKLLNLLDTDKKEGEKEHDFQKRLKQEIDNIL